MNKLGILDKLRAWPLLVLGVVVLALVVDLNAAKLGLMLWGLARVFVFGYLGYWLDRVAFPYARPHTQSGMLAATAWLRRACIIAACVIAGGLLP